MTRELLANTICIYLQSTLSTTNSRRAKSIILETFIITKLINMLAKMSRKHTHTRRRSSLNNWVLVGRRMSFGQRTRHTSLLFFQRFQLNSSYPPPPWATRITTPSGQAMLPTQTPCLFKQTPPIFETSSKNSREHHWNSPPSPPHSISFL